MFDGSAEPIGKILPNSNATVEDSVEQKNTKYQEKQEQADYQIDETDNKLEKKAPTQETNDKLYKSFGMYMEDWTNDKKVPRAEQRRQCGSLYYGGLTISRKRKKSSTQIYKKIKQYIKKKYFKKDPLISGYQRSKIPVMQVHPNEETSIKEFRAQSPISILTLDENKSDSDDSVIILGQIINGHPRSCFTKEEFIEKWWESVDGLDKTDCEQCTKKKRNCTTVNVGETSQLESKKENEFIGKADVDIINQEDWKQGVENENGKLLFFDLQH